MQKFLCNGLALPNCKEPLISTIIACRSSVLGALGKHFLYIVCFMLFGIGVARSQSPAREAVDNHSITPLNIGDPIPDELWNTPLQVVNHPDGKGTITLSEYKDKLIILDFWATWCVPCIKSLYKLDSLQKEFGEDVAIIPTSYEAKDKVANTFRERGWELPTAFSDTVTKQFFPHKAIPHQVVIHNSKVLAITSSNEINIEKIANILAGEEASFKVKKEIKYDRFKSIISHLDTVERQKAYQSILTGYVAGISNTGYQDNGELQELHAFNAPIVFMYRNILKDIYANEIDLEIEDKEWYYKYERGVYDNLFCFQLIIPSNVSPERMRSIAVNNLNSYFNLNGRFEKRDKECYVIKDMDKASESPVIDTLEKRELSPKVMLGLLNYSLVWRPELNRFLNESSYQGSFWVENSKFISSLKNDIGKLNQFLSDYGLIAVKETRELEVFVLSEN